MFLETNKGGSVGLSYIHHATAMYIIDNINYLSGLHRTNRFKSIKVLASKSSQPIKNLYLIICIVILYLSALSTC